MAQAIIFAYSYNKFHATLTTMGFWATICQIPGVLQYPAPVYIYERQIPGPRELSIGQIPGGVPGGGMVTPGIDSCIMSVYILLLNTLIQGRRGQGRGPPIFYKRGQNNLCPHKKFIYRVYKKKLNRFEIALSFGKQLLVSSF